MNNPEFVQIDDKKYKINTDFRVVLRFNKLVSEKKSNMELILGTLTLFYGKEGTNRPEHMERLLKSALEFVKGRPNSMHIDKNEKIKKDMDYEKDWGLIQSSMKQVYGIDLNTEKLHWWTFFDYLNGMPSDCALNQVREIRNKDLSKIKDRNEREEYIKLKQQWKLEEENRSLTKEQEESINRFYELTGIERK